MSQVIDNSLRIDLKDQNLNVSKDNKMKRSNIIAWQSFNKLNPFYQKRR